MSREIDNTIIANQNLVGTGVNAIGDAVSLPSNPLAVFNLASDTISLPGAAANAAIANVTWPERFAIEQIGEAYFRPRSNVVSGPSPFQGFYDVGMSAGERKLKSQMDYEALLQEQEDYDAAQAEPLYYVDDEGNYYYY